jgi:hypothetical protein
LNPHAPDYQGSAVFETAALPLVRPLRRSGARWENRTPVASLEGWSLSHSANLALELVRRGGLEPLWGVSPTRPTHHHTVADNVQIKLEMPAVDTKVISPEELRAGAIVQPEPWMVRHLMDHPELMRDLSDWEFQVYIARRPGVRCGVARGRLSVTTG